jgi:hypothetical protein
MALFNTFIIYRATILAVHSMSRRAIARPRSHLRTIGINSIPDILIEGIIADASHNGKDQQRRKKDCS